MYWLKSVVLKITIEITVGKVWVVYVERGQKDKVMKYGKGPGESSVHRPWTSSLRHCHASFMCKNENSAGLNVLKMYSKIWE